MQTSIIISGFGGQGVLFAGQLLAYAGMDSGRYVTWIPSYGPEMRGGTANCTVVVADEPIGAPLVNEPDIAVALNLPSFEKYLHLVRPDGLLVVNSSIVQKRASRPGLEVIYIPANEIAESQGSTKMLNMAAVGGMLARRPVLGLEPVQQALRAHLPASKAWLLDANLRVLALGYQAARDQVAA